MATRGPIGTGYLEQLKADAYDCLVQIEQWQLKLREANQKIATYKEPSA